MCIETSRLNSYKLSLHVSHDRQLSNFNPTHFNNGFVLVFCFYSAHDLPARFCFVSIYLKLLYHIEIVSRWVDERKRKEMFKEQLKDIENWRWKTTIARIFFLSLKRKWQNCRKIGKKTCTKKRHHLRTQKDDTKHIEIKKKNPYDFQIKTVLYLTGISFSFFSFHYRFKRGRKPDLYGRDTGLVVRADVSWPAIRRRSGRPDGNWRTRSMEGVGRWRRDPWCRIAKPLGNSCSEMRPSIHCRTDRRTESC